MVRLTFYASLLILGILLLVSPRDIDSRVAPEIVAEKIGDLEPPDPLAMAAALAAALPKDATAETVFNSTCAMCHGPSGGGNAEMKAPSIGGMPDWFLAIQLEKFRNGLRGGGEGDHTGEQMLTIARALDEAQVPALAEYVAAMTISPTASTLEGDPRIGEELFLENCAGCHRYNAHGEKAFRSAPLSSLQDWYLLAQLLKFRDQVRGYHSNDIDGIFMHRALKYLSDDDFHHIVARVVELAEKYPPDRRRPRPRMGERYGEEKTASAAAPTSTPESAPATTPDPTEPVVPSIFDFPGELVTPAPTESAPQPSQ